MYNSNRVQIQRRRTGLAITLIILLGTTGLIVGCSGDIAQPDLDDTEYTVDTGDDLLNPDKAGSTLIRCQGTRCTRPGEAIIAGYPARSYSYIVTPGRTAVNNVDIGIDGRTSVLYAGINSIIMPVGWTMNIINVEQPPHQIVFRTHGYVTNSNNTCRKIIRFSTTNPLHAQTSQFQLAFDYGSDAHEVSWDTSDGSVSNWNLPVGKGAGPAHSPVRPATPTNAELYDHEILEP